MFGFGSSSSSSSSASSSSTEPSLPAAPNREERKACWESRDLYFGCLDKNGVLVAGQADAGGKKVCEAERKGYEGSCSKSWATRADHQVEYFNKRRILELRQKATLEAAAHARDTNVVNQGR